MSPPSRQVGIHERSAREKISHVMNESGMAHIMNDEATRKYFQVWEERGAGGTAGGQGMAHIMNDEATRKHFQVGLPGGGQGSSRG